MYKRIKNKLKREVKVLKKLFSNKAIVLIYHRVAAVEPDPQLLAVDPVNFEAQMKYLKKNFNVISLKELIAGLNAGYVLNKSIAITFDDGYFDNLYNAKPILEKYELPATFFISTGYIESHKEYWWDELERIFIIECPQKKLSIEINGELFQYDIISKEVASRVYMELNFALKKLKHSERDNIIQSLFSWADLERIGRESHRSLTSIEVKELAENSLFDIGAHTINHPVLSRESYNVQRTEILGSINRLRKILKTDITLFSYPFGGKNDYNSDSIKILQNNDIKAGISNIQGYLTKDIDEWNIPRYLVRNWDVDFLKKKIRYAFKRL